MASGIDPGGKREVNVPVKEMDRMIIGQEEFLKIVGAIMRGG